MSDELFSTIFFFIVIGAPFCGAQQCNPSDGYEYICKGIVHQFPETYYNAYQLRCDECQISHFDNETFPFGNEFRRFNVSNSGIKYVGARSFGHFLSLQYLYLHKNQIENISKGAFEGLNHLNELYLESNLLVTIKPGTLRGVSADVVNISNNILGYLPAHAFDGTIKLFDLDLSRNQLNKLDKDTFEELKSLKVLNLSFNWLCHLPLGIFKSLSALEHLALNNNQFMKISSGAFSGLNHLNYLSLAQNFLTDFDPSILLSINYLKQLDVSSNNIRNLNVQNLISYAPTLKVVTLEDNMFSCDMLASSLKFFKSKSITVQNNIFRFDCLNIGGIACIRSLQQPYTISLYSFLEQAEEEARLEELSCLVYY